MKKLFLLIFFAVITCCLTAQQIEMLSTDHKVSLRGLSVVTDKIVWASGSKGSVTRSEDGGKTWKWLSVPGFEKRDFRDIEAFDAMTAIIMAIDTPAIILKTTDGGLHWKKVYQNNTPGMFMDAMEFTNAKNGIIVGDPINGKFFITQTIDAGNTWQDIAFDKLPPADSGEGCFASSGTNIRAVNIDEACFITGGTHARFFWKGNPVELPLLQGGESQGANSIAVQENTKDSRYFVVVGGDFTHDTSVEKNCAITTDGGKTWTKPATPPHGYRSCVTFISKTNMITCGTSGIDVSADAGMNWKNVSKESFHVCTKAKKGNAIYLAGNGRIARFSWK